MPTFAILGSGGWGTTLAIHLAKNPEHTVRLWSRQEETAQELRAKRVNVRQLPGVTIPPNVLITANEREATLRADCWIEAIPTAHLRSTLTRFAPLEYRPDSIVSLTKGIEQDTFLRPTQVIEEVLGVSRLAALSGPSHAEEVACGRPTSVVVASPDVQLARWIQHNLAGDRLRIYTNKDLIGVELAGALKNVLGIAAGICDGLKFGDNAKAALLSRGILEARQFGVEFGANAETFLGLAGIGDLITTCFSGHGRNRRVGERLASGEPLDKILCSPQVAEGVYTAKSVYDRILRQKLDAPILSAVHRVLTQEWTALEAVQELLDRPLKPEL
jgi:glycerol-3-phosphate dehydrogenase (NAD(P)+)